MHLHLFLSHLPVLLYLLPTLALYHHLYLINTFNINGLMPAAAEDQ